MPQRTTWQPKIWPLRAWPLRVWPLRVWLAAWTLAVCLPPGVAPVVAQDLELLPPLDSVLEIQRSQPLEVQADPIAAAVSAPPQYAWYQPKYYLDPEIWEGSIEVGVNGSSGNTDTFNITAGYDLKRETDRFVVSSDLKYFNASTGAVQTQNYAIFNAGVEWKLPDSPWSAFSRSQLQFNEFQPWDLRLVLNGGLAYRMIDEEDNKLKFRFGAGVSREFGGGDEEWKPEALLGMDAQQKLNDRQTIVAKTDYYPTFSDFSDYRMVSDVSWQIVLDEATNLSLKLGVVTNYDSTPNPGAVGADVNYVVMLMWKL